MTQPPSPEPAPVTDAEAQEELARLSLPTTRSGMGDGPRGGSHAEEFTLRLLADRARVQERIVALEDWLLNIGWHKSGCGETQHPHMHRGVDCDESHPCDCGWWELKKTLLPQEVPE